jgi:hypothetical protein
MLLSSFRAAYFGVELAIHTAQTTTHLATQAFLIFTQTLKDAYDAFKKTVTETLTAAIATIQNAASMRRRIGIDAFRAFLGGALSFTTLLVTHIYNHKDRDFTRATQERLLGLIRKAKQDTCPVTNWLLDPAFADAAHSLGIVGLLKDTNRYQESLLDMNNTSEQQLNKVFDDVYAIDAKYAKKFTEHAERLHAIHETIRRAGASVMKYAE